MPPDPPNQPPPDAAELIARAKRDAAAELAEQMLARMAEDDEMDERDGVEISDSSSPGPGVESDEWDLSGRSSSPRRDSSARGSSILGDTGPTETGAEAKNPVEESLAGGATMAEGSVKPPTTLNVPLDAALAGDATEDADSSQQAAEPPAPRYRPERRPPMATLVACDDGRDDGEVVRLRKTPFDVGRVEGDLVIAHDNQMSRRHFRIERRPSDDGWQWRLTDLESLNGTFLQRREARIDDGDELMLAGEVLRVRHAGAGKLTLTHMAGGKTGQRVTLDPGEHLLGADPSACVPLLANAPLLAPQHLRLECDRSGRWSAAALPTTDGLWLRAPSFPLQDGARWQTGEQRFAFHLP